MTVASVNKPRPSAASTKATSASGKSPAKTSAPPATKPASSIVKIVRASIGDGPKTTSAISLPKGYKAKVESIESNAKDVVHGKPASIEQSVQVVTVTGPKGEQFKIGRAEAVEQFASDWRAEVDAAKKEAAPEYPSHLTWFAESGYRGAGSAGKLFSVSEGGSTYMGGMHPNNGGSLRTYDARTGAQVKLDKLLTPAQMKSLVNAIDAQLPRMRGPQEIDGTAFHFGDKDSLRQTVNENFTVTTDKKGKVQLHVAWDSGVHALSGMMIHFTVDAPTEAAFQKKLGLR